MFIALKYSAARNTCATYAASSDLAARKRQTSSDLDGVKGAYHITCADCGSQWQVMACVQGIRGQLGDSIFRELATKIGRMKTALDVSG